MAATFTLTLKCIRDEREGRKVEQVFRGVVQVESGIASTWVKLTEYFVIDGSDKEWQWNPRASERNLDRGLRQRELGGPARFRESIGKHIWSDLPS